MIQPADIESELERIWKSLQGTNKMRACLFNLIIYAKKNERVNYLTEVVQKIIEKFPSRVIFITHDDDAEKEQMRTNVSAMTADEGENAIVCDLIDIEVTSSYLERVPFIVLPHILPDLPVYLVHVDDPSIDNPICRKLEHLADRIIFDSESTTNLPAFAKAVLRNQESSQADVADLNWARIEGWRQLFASVFKAKDDLQLLLSTTTIHIRYNSTPTESLCHTNIQSIYLQGWIACQLGWKLQKITEEGGILLFDYETEHFPVRIFLEGAKMQELAPGRIIAVEIETDHQYRFSFKRDISYLNHILIEKSTPEMCALPSHFVFDKDVSGQSLVKEVCHKGTSNHYRNLLILLSSIKEHGLCS